MPTALEYTKEAQQQTLKTIHDSQETIVEAVRTWANAVDKATPEIPDLDLPTPEQVVETSFAFAEQLLRAQRQFVESVIEAAKPAFESAPAKSKAGARKAA
jgi:hypothetical protein